MTEGAPPDGGAAGRPRRARSGRARSLPKRTRILIGVTTVGLIVVLGLLYGLNLVPQPNSSPPPGSPPVDKVVDSGKAPDFTLPSVFTGQPPVDLSKLKGRPVVVNFWGSWCIPCRTELPILAAAAKAEGARVHFVGVDLEDTRAGARAMLRRYGVPYPSGFDPGDSVASRFAVVGTPTTVFIDSRGHRVGTVPGALTAPRLVWWLNNVH